MAKIDETEAALLLGITKELLYAFVKTGVKGMKLPVKGSSVNDFFETEDLNRWDDFLNAPWANCSTDKPPIPLAIREYLKAESEGKCTRCGKGHRLQHAHIIPWSKSLSHHPHNLIRLCTDCHAKYDEGIISMEEIKAIKEEKIQRTKNNLLSEKKFSARGILSTPNPDSIFIGRQTELSFLSHLFEKHRIIHIEGVGGIGKTQLLLQFIKRESIDVLWYNIEQYRSLDDFHFHLIRQVGGNDFNHLVKILDDRKAVLVLDNFEVLYLSDPDNSLVFLKTLYNHTSKTRFMLTSQVDIADVTMNPGIIRLVRGLSDNESFQIMHKYVPNIEIQDKAIMELIWFSEGHPLTLRLIAGLIRFMTDPQKVLKSLDESGVKILKDFRFDQQKRSTSLVVCLQAAYESLDALKKWLLKYLSYYPTGCKINYSIGFFTGKRGRFSSEAELYMAISILNQFNFIEVVKDVYGLERANMLNPVRSFVQEKGVEESLNVNDLKIEAYSNLANEATVLSEYSLTDRANISMRMYERELPNFIAAISESANCAYFKCDNRGEERRMFLKIILKLSTGLQWFLTNRGYWQYGVYISEQGVKAAVELGEDSQVVDLLGKLVDFNQELGDQDGVEDALKRMWDYRAKLSDKPVSVIINEGKLLQKENPEAAIALFLTYIKTCEKQLSEGINVAFTKGNIAVLLCEIAGIYGDLLSDIPTALTYYMQGYEIQKEVKDLANMYTCCYNVGYLYTALGDCKNAIRFYSEAIIGFSSLGQQQNLSNALAEFGKLKMKHPEVDIDFLSREILYGGLYDVEVDFKEALKSHHQISGNEGVPKIKSTKVLRLWSIIRLVSISEHSSLLMTWASNLITLFGRSDGSDLSMKYCWIFLHIARLTCVIERYPEDWEKVFDLKEACYLTGHEKEHTIYDPYEWLGLWLKVKKIDIKATRDSLLAEVGRVDLCNPGEAM